MKLFISTILLVSSLSVNAGICTSEAIRLQHMCTLDQFDSDCKQARADWNECRQIIRQYADESRRNELDRKHKDFEGRHDNSIGSWIKFITGIEL